MNDNAFLYWLLGTAIGIFFLFFLLRWIFQVEKHMRYQEVQINLLMKMAAKLGVTPDEIDGIRNYAKAAYNS